jgi:type VI secretion system ImpA family protein
VKTALEEIDALNRTMHQRLGSRSPGVSALRQAAEEVEAALRGLAREKGVLDAGAAPTDSDGQAEQQPAATAAAHAPAGPIASRDDAYRRLDEVARYLRTHDRHSPVPLLLQKILSWKDLPFDQLLREIVRDANARAQAYEMLGVRDAGTEDSPSASE